MRLLRLRHPEAFLKGQAQILVISAWREMLFAGDEIIMETVGGRIGGIPRVDCGIIPCKVHACPGPYFVPPGHWDRMLVSGSGIALAALYGGLTAEREIGVAS